MSETVDPGQPTKTGAGGPMICEVSPPVLRAEETRISRWIDGYTPRPLDYVFENMIVRKTVGNIFAAPGTGKTFFGMHLGISAASGVSFGPFIPMRPCKVLMLCAEDPEIIVKNRVHAITQAGCYDETPLRENFHIVSVVGQVSPLMRLESNGNPSPSEYARWLESTIEAHPCVELLIIDPLSRFFGLEENRNEHAGAFVRLLESIALRHNLTIIFTHHVSKAMKSQDATKGSGRGAQAFEDCCRWVAGLGFPGEPEGRRLDIPEHQLRNYVKFNVTKTSYTPGLPASDYFIRGAEGVLMHIRPSSDRLRRVATSLSAALAESGPIRRTDLNRGRNSGKQIMQGLREEFGKITQKDMRIAIDLGLREQILDRETTKNDRGPASEKIKSGFGECAACI